LFPALRWQFDRLFGLFGALASSSDVQSPLEFKYLCGAASCAAVPWLAMSLYNMLPAIKTVQDVPQVSVHATALFMYPIWFIVVRAAFVLPGISSAWTHLYSQATRFLLMCLATLLLGELPMFIFLLTSVILCLTLGFQSRLANALMFWAIQSGLVGVLCLFQVTWRRRLAFDASRQSDSQRQAAPPETIDKLQTLSYDEGRNQPGECPICLEGFKLPDSIKVTPCRHVFHEDCLAHWLQKACTCAVCRRDLVKAAERSETSEPATSRQAITPTSD